jgi:hypothetical protein
MKNEERKRRRDEKWRRERSKLKRSEFIEFFMASN